MTNLLHEAQLIIFDCDGVLVDTEPLTNRLLAEVITEAGWSVTAEDSIRMFKGRDLNEIVGDVERRVGRALPDLLTDYRARMFEAFEDGIEPIEGVRELLDTLDARGVHQRCVASNGPMNKMEAALGSAGMLDRFDDEFGRRIYSAYDIGRWKPDPGLFLHAADQFDIPPAGCVVIEDSVSGVQAAVAGGMPVIGLAGLTATEALRSAGASVVIDSLRTIRSWID